MTFTHKIKSLFRSLKNLASFRELHEQQLLVMGNLLSEQKKNVNPIASLFDTEFKIFSQFGDDGIIQWLVRNIDFPNKTFIEFGVENFRESNTRFLMMNNNWSGLVMDGSESSVKQIIESEYFWKYSLQAKTAFITVENINDLISSSGFEPDVGILHIDLDGNDYWVWEAINTITPLVVIVEYNSIFGPDEAITIPYDPNFYRTRAHFSNLYFGTSLKAISLLAEKKGYSFIGSNSAGNNAYFVRNDKLNNNVKKVSVQDGFVISKFRQSRSTTGVLTHLNRDAEIEQIIGMPVHNVITGKIELFGKQ